MRRVSDLQSNDRIRGQHSDFKRLLCRLSGISTGNPRRADSWQTDRQNAISSNREDSGFRCRRWKYLRKATGKGEARRTDRFRQTAALVGKNEAVISALQPMKALAKEYGVSDVALAKTCKKLLVPVPGRGFWRRRWPEWQFPKDQIIRRSIQIECAD